METGLWESSESLPSLQLCASHRIAVKLPLVKSVLEAKEWLQEGSGELSQGQGFLCSHWSEKKASQHKRP